MPDLIKVGSTDRTVEERVAELNSATGVPTPFVPVLIVAFPNPAVIEELVHKDLDKYRVNSSREFFRTSVELVIGCVYERRHEFYRDQLLGWDDASLVNLIDDILRERRSVAPVVGVNQPKRVDRQELQVNDMSEDQIYQLLDVIFSSRPRIYNKFKEELGRQRG